MKVSTINITPSGRDHDGNVLPSDVTITMDDGSSYSVPTIIPAGTTGKRGSIWTSGTDTPTVLTDTTVGDMYFCTGNATLYQFDENDWKVLGVFKGDKGDTGTSITKVSSTSTPVSAGSPITTTVLVDKSDNTTDQFNIVSPPGPQGANGGPDPYAGPNEVNFGWYEITSFGAHNVYTRSFPYGVVFRFPPRVNITFVQAFPSEQWGNYTDNWSGEVQEHWAEDSFQSYGSIEVETVGRSDFTFSTPGAWSGLGYIQYDVKGFIDPGKTATNQLTLGIKPPERVQDISLSNIDITQSTPTPGQNSSAVWTATLSNGTIVKAPFVIPSGPQGVNGHQWYTGLDPSTSGYTVPEGIAELDMYLATDTSKIYLYTGGKLVYKSQLTYVGPNLTSVQNVINSTTLSTTVTMSDGTTRTGNVDFSSSVNTLINNAPVSPAVVSYGNNLVEFMNDGYSQLGGQINDAKNTVANETARAEKAETTLQNNINTLTSNTISNVPEGNGSSTKSLYLDSNGNPILRDTSDNAIQLVKEPELTTETQARVSGDQANATAITNEITNRGNAISTLQSNLDNESTTRANADTTLGSRIDQLSSDTTKAISDQKTQVESDIQSAVSGLNTTINNNDAARKSDITSLTTSIGNEVTARTSADNTLQSNIDKLSDTVKSISSTTDGNTGGISTEVSDRKADTTSIRNDLQTEVQNRTSADTALSDRIDSTNNTVSSLSTSVTNLTQEVQDETSARVSGDNALSSKIDSLSTSTSNNLASAQKQLQTNIDTNTAAIKQEVSDRTNAISSEATARSQADSTLQTNINNEAATRASADAAISSKVDTLRSDVANNYLPAQDGVVSVNTTFTGSVLTNNLNIGSTSSSTQGAKLYTSGSDPNKPIFNISVSNSSTTPVSTYTISFSSTDGSLISPNNSPYLDRSTADAKYATQSSLSGYLPLSIPINTTVTGNTLTFGNNVNFTALATGIVPSDSPGSTSTALATTSWVDKYYTTPDKVTATVNSAIATALTDNYIATKVDPTDDAIVEMAFDNSKRAPWGVTKSGVFFHCVVTNDTTKSTDLYINSVGIDGTNGQLWVRDQNQQYRTFSPVGSCIPSTGGTATGDITLYGNTAGNNLYSRTLVMKADDSNISGRLQLMGTATEPAVYLSVIDSANTSHVWTFNIDGSIIGPSGQVALSNETVGTFTDSNNAKCTNITFQHGDLSSPMAEMSGGVWTRLLVADNPLMTQGFTAEVDGGSYLALQNTDTNFIYYNSDKSIRWALGTQTFNTVFNTPSVVVNSLTVNNTIGSDDSVVSITPTNGGNGYTSIAANGGIQQAGMLQKNIGQYGIAVSNNNFANYAEWIFDLSTRKMYDPYGNPHLTTANGVQGNYGLIPNTVTVKAILQNVHGGLSYCTSVNGSDVWKTVSTPIGTIIESAQSGSLDDYLPMNATVFDKNIYPDLYTLLGTNVTPDARGLFMRGLDPTGNVDNYGSTRALLSVEEGSYIVGDRLSYGRTYTQIAKIVGNNSTWGSSNGGSLSSLGWDMPYNTKAMPPVGYVGMTQEYNLGIAPDSSGNYTYTTGSALHGIARPKNMAVNYYIRAR